MKKKPNKQPKMSAQDRAIDRLYGKGTASAGGALVDKFAADGSLGRVSTQLEGSSEALDRIRGLSTGRSVGESEALERMKAGLGGYTSPEYQAQREQMLRGIQSNAAATMSQLAKAQARGKVYGPAAVAQQRSAMRDAESSKNNLEQDLYIKNIDEMRSRNSEYGEYSGKLNNDEYTRGSQVASQLADEQARQREEVLKRETTNMGQVAAEKASQIGAYTGAGATNLAKAQNKAANRISRQGIKAMK